ncbi:MAG: preprotein translocase subunit YajC [Planctomycetes bacterium]|nr:preprotein translocase subunit YajC [Planctomycetota bacterium]
MLYMMPLFLVLMYFFMIRPEQKRKKEQQSLLASIKQGDTVVTISGMHGVVSALTDKTVTLRVDTVNMTFDRSAVARIEREPGAEDAAAQPAGKQGS